jgi:hypothetical protein
MFNFINFWKHHKNQEYRCVFSPLAKETTVVIQKHSVKHKLHVKKILAKKPIEVVPKQIKRKVIFKANPKRTVKYIYQRGDNWIPRKKIVQTKARIKPAVVAPVKIEDAATIPIIYPYNIESDAAKLLSKALNTKRVKENGRYIYRPNHLIINYGNKRVPSWSNGVKVNILNPWDAIKLSSNKLSALQAFQAHNVSTVPFTTDKKQAIDWVNKKKSVMCRTILNGYGGHGIVIASKADEVVDAPLYSLYTKSKGEYRIVVVNGIVIDFMQKKRKLDFEAKNGIKINGMVRNHENGFIYARQEIAPPKKVIDEAVKAVSALGLNFGGVDVIYNEKKDAAYVLESNSSIGLEPEGTTLKRLAAAFRAICDGKPPVSII